MIKVSEIIELWKQDTEIDDLNIDKEVAKLPTMHSKYLEHLSRERGALRGLHIQKQQLVKKLREYYLGRLNQEELEEFGREPFQIRVLSNEVATYIDGDSAMIKLQGNIAMQEEKVDLLQEIVKAINFRNNQFTNIINWKRLMLGG